MTPLSIVVATRNRPEQLAVCLERLRAGCRPEDEIVVVDSASSGTATREVASAAGVTHVRVDAPGASLARNRGWQAARHEAVAFIDDDVIVAPDWVARMASALDDPDVGFVTGWIGVPPGQEDVPDPQPYITEPEPRALTFALRSAFGAGANWGVRRTGLDAVGGFDERLGPATWFAAAEDADLYDRLVLAGYVGRYCPDVRVDHDAWRTKGQRLRQHWAYGKGNGARLRLLLHLDRRRARQQAAAMFWSDGVVTLSRHFRARWLTGVLCSALRLAGTALAFAIALGRLRDPWPPTSWR